MHADHVLRPSHIKRPGSLKPEANKYFDAHIEGAAWDMAAQITTIGCAVLSYARKGMDSLKI
jgi:hypothetical protein